jgi:hypothetical protein
MSIPSSAAGQVYLYSIVLLHISKLRPLCLFALACLLLPAASSAQTPVLTQHNNNARTGAYTTETVLTPANVNQTTFGKLFSYPVDGRIYAQPLYVPNVSITGKGIHNVVFIATEHDSVYAFDADSNGGSNSTPLWKITLLDSAHGATSGATSVPNGDLSSADIVPEVGITGTPVIDTSTGTLYVVGKTKEGLVANPSYVQRLHALNLSNGAEKLGGPVTLSASVPGTGNGTSGGVLNFDPKWQMNRSGLLLQNGVVYIALGSHGDNGPWHGWILSYSAASLAQISAFCTTPNGSGSGIWMSGAGLAGDVIDSVNKPYGRMFVATGNGSFDATPPYDNTMSYGDDIVRLDLSGGKLTPQDSFTPSNQATLSAADLDVASGGVLLLPDQTVGGHTHLLIQAGKEGKVYLVDRDNMGGFNASSDNLVQEIAGKTGGLWSIPAFWNNTLYTWGKEDSLQAFTLSNGLLSANPSASGSPTSNYPGASPSVSSNGNSNGIVWAVQTDGYNTSAPAIVRAYDATNIRTALYDSNLNAARDTAGLANKFAMPTIANGKVYVGTANELDVYGLLATSPTAATPVISPASQQFTTSLSVTITDSTAGATIYYTTDGSTPSTSSTKYTGPITVSTTQTITAVASATGFLQSLASSQTYTLQNQVAAPSFSPASSNFSSPISVSLSDTVAGAKIYYTTDGTAPTTASALYSAPIAVSITTTIKAMAAAAGLVSSNVASATYTYTPPQSGTGSNFVNGFSSASLLMKFNGSTGLADTRLQLTDGGFNEAGSAWYNTPLNIQSFTNDFTFQIANPDADGFTFTIQNTGLTALGPSGGGLGFGPDAPGGTPGIPKSVAIKFDIFDNVGEGTDSTGLFTNGASPTTPAVNLTNTGINLLSGDTFSVHMVYNGTTLTMTITDGVTNASYTTSWTVNIPQIVGANNAYVGFTGGTGGQTASQKIETWTFTPTTQSPSQVATPTFSLAAGTYLGTQTVSLSDSTSGATIFYTIDGTTPATSAGGSTAQYTGPLTVSSTRTIKAIATASAFSASTVASATYTIQSQVAAPTFSPVGGTYTSAQTISLSSTTAGASLYYTLDGSTPTTSAGGSTLLYSAPISITASKTVKAIATASGYFASNVSTAVYTISSGGSGSINFGGGFAGGGMIFNGSTALDGTRLRLTDGGTVEAASAWYSSPVSVSSFTSDFSFQVTPGTTPTADGFAFVIQGNNTTVIGPTGGGLGYGSDMAGVLAANAIPNSVAIKFDLYSNSGEGDNSTGLYTNGASPTTPYVDLTTTGIDLHSGHVFNVHMAYDGTTLAMTITDTVTAGTFKQSWPINLSTTIGSSTAYFGFSGGTGGLTAIQEIINWTYTPNLIVATAAAPTFSPAAGMYTSAQTVTISDTTSGATIYYTTDGSTPTTASTKYTAPISVASSLTLKAIATATGFSTSAVASAAYAINTPVAISFGNGFTSSSGLQLNGGSALSGTRLRVTDGGLSEGRSAFWTTPVNVQTFTTDFTFQQAQGTNPTGDGFAFVLQNSSIAALGPVGGGLGYGPDTPGGTNPISIPNSIAIKFDLYSNSGEGANSTGLYTNGASPTIPAVDLSSSVIDLHSGHIFAAHIAYDGTTLALSITDTTTSASFSTSWPLNIPTTIGGTTAFAGFTGGTGGATAVQDVITWTYSAGATKTAISYSTSNLTAVNSGANFRTFDWSGFPDNQGTILDATAVGNSVSFTVNVAQAGIYAISYSTKKTTNRGTAQLAINGANTGPTSDQYAANDTTYGFFNLGTFNFATAGNYSFKFTVTGKNASSTSYQIAFDDIILTPQ